MITMELIKVVINMRIIILSVFIALFAGDSEEKRAPPLRYTEYIDQQFIHFGFDHDGYKYPFSGLEGKRQSWLDRKKLIFFCYFQIHKSKFSDTYLEMLDRIEDIVAEFSRHPPKTSPALLTWDAFKAEYKKQGVTQLPFVGYGSLSNAKDLLRTLPDKKVMTHVIGFGGKRVFKIESPTLLTRGLPAEGFELEAAKLALEEAPEYGLNKLFNGVVFELKESEVEALEKRNPDYAVKKVPVIRVDALFKNPVQVEYAYALFSNATAKEELKPHLNYLNLVLSSFDDGNIEAQDTIRLFSETTYLADGKTNIENWLESEVQKYYQDDLLVQAVVEQHLKAINSLSAT
jgi:hypothetical protein